jgi:hypothetical protein
MLRHRGDEQIVQGRGSSRACGAVRSSGTAMAQGSPFFPVHDPCRRILAAENG